MKDRKEDGIYRKKEKEIKMAGGRENKEEGKEERQRSGRGKTDKEK